ALKCILLFEVEAKNKANEGHYVPDAPLVKYQETLQAMDMTFTGC
ncbi:hypothetical protein NPIL_609671, partial [Nephila pilipes]